MASNTTGTLPDDKLNKNWKARGWIVDRKSHVCPACQAKSAKPKLALVPKENPVAAIITTHPAAKVETPVPALDVDTALVIADALSEVYDKKTGYKPNRSDLEIAKGLGVPSEWVREVRRKRYGAGPEPEEVKRMREEVKGLDAKIDALNKTIRVARAEARALTQAAETLNKRLAAIQEAVK